MEYIQQGDALTCLLFNKALEKVIVAAAVNTSGSISCKSVQVLSYADDIDIIGKTQSAVIEAFISIENAAKRMDLHINQGRTKYVPVIKKSHASYPSYLAAGSYKFQVVQTFTY